MAMAAALSAKFKAPCGVLSLSQCHRSANGDPTPKARPVLGRLGNAGPLHHRQLLSARVLNAPRKNKHRGKRWIGSVSPVAAITAVGTGANEEPERPPTNEFLDDPEVGRRSESGRYMGNKEKKTVTVVINGKLLAEKAVRAGEAVRNNMWPPNKHWLSFLVAPAALLLALVAARVQQLKSAPVTPSVTTSIAMAMPPKGSSPELKVVGVMGSLPNTGRHSQVTAGAELQEGERATWMKVAEQRSESQGAIGGSTKAADKQTSALLERTESGPQKQHRWVDAPLARNSEDAEGKSGEDMWKKPIADLTDVDFYNELQKEAEIEAKVRRARGFPMKDDSQFGLFDEEEKKAMQELVASGSLDEETQKRLEELLKQEEGNSKFKKAAQRAMGKHVKKAGPTKKSPISDEEIWELEEAAKSGFLNDEVQKEVEDFLKTEKEYRKTLEEGETYDDDEYDESEYMEEEDDPELDALIAEMVESGEFEAPMDGEDDEEDMEYADEDGEDDDYDEEDDDDDLGGTFWGKGSVSSGKSSGSAKIEEIQEDTSAASSSKGEKKGGGETKRVRAGVRELTDKLGLTVKDGGARTDWEAELRKKTLARIGPFDFSNRQEGQQTAPDDKDALGASQAVPSDAAVIEAVEASTSQESDFPFSQAFREASEAARRAEQPEQRSPESSSNDAVWPGEAAAGVQVAALESSTTSSDEQTEAEAEIVFRVVEPEEPCTSGAGPSERLGSSGGPLQQKDGTIEEDDLSSSKDSTAVGSCAETASRLEASASSSEGSDKDGSKAGPGVSLAGEDVTPLVELLRKKEQDEDYALRTSWGTYAELSPMKRRWQVWADKQAAKVKLGAAKVKVIDSKDIKFSNKEPAMEGQRHYVYQVQYKSQRYALKMPKRPDDRGNQKLLLQEAANLANVQGANVIGLQGVVQNLGSLPLYRLGRASGPLMTAEQLAQGVEKGTVEDLQSCVLPDGSKQTVQAILEGGASTPNVHGLLMEYAEGSDLQSQLDKTQGEHKVQVDEAWHIFRQLAMGLGEIHAGRLAHNNVDLSNVLLVSDDSQASGVRCCWSGLSMGKKTDTAGNVRLSPEERLGRLMRQDDYYQAPELTDASAAVLYNGFKADTYALGKAFLLLVGDEYEQQADQASDAVRDMDRMFAMTLQPEPQNRATSVELMKFTRQKELEAIERWREKEDVKLEEMARAGLPKTEEELVLEKMMDEDPEELRQAEEEAFEALLAEMRKRQAEEEAGEGSEKQEEGKRTPRTAPNRTK